MRKVLVLMIVVFAFAAVSAEVEKFSASNFHIDLIVERNDVPHILVRYVNRYYVLKEGDELPELVKVIKIGKTDVLVYDYTRKKETKINLWIEWVKEDELGSLKYLFNTVSMVKKDTVRNLCHFICNNIPTEGKGAYGVYFYIAPTGYDREVSVAEDSITALSLLYKIADRAKLELRLQKGCLVFYDKYAGLSGLGK